MRGGDDPRFVEQRSTAHVKVLRLFQNSRLEFKMKMIYLKIKTSLII